MDGYRHENKYYISTAGYQMLRGRLQAALETDPNTVHPDGKYMIRSLYFDDYCQTGLLDKVEGIEDREKFRIRFYDMRDDFIRLEAKQKRNNLTKKLSARLTRPQVERILAGDTWFLYDAGKEQPCCAISTINAAPACCAPPSSWTTTGKPIFSRTCA